MLTKIKFYSDFEIDAETELLDPKNGMSIRTTLLVRLRYRADMGAQEMVHCETR